MLIIINDDAAYVSWLTHHRQGYVVDARRQPGRGHAVLHRANCSVIKPHKRARLTAGAHLKACSLDVAELEEWARDYTGSQLAGCPECVPYEQESTAAGHDEAQALTRLGKDILSYVLDLAVMYLDGQQTQYRPTIVEVAEYLDKTPMQIRPAAERLIEEGYLECNGQADRPPAPYETAVVYPTARSLRSIPAFADMPAKALNAELDELKQKD